MNNFRRSLPDNTNRHALILTHSLSRFTPPRCALHSDNPGLWDIQLSSRDFFECNAKVMSLIKSAISWFQGITRTTWRLLWQQTSGHHALVTSGDSGRLPVNIHALVTKLQTTRATGLAHTQSLSDHWQTDSDFQSLGCRFPQEETQGWTHTHRHSATAMTTYAAFDFRDSSSVRSSPLSALR